LVTSQPLLLGGAKITHHFVAVAEIYRKLGVSGATFYNWKKK